MRFSTYPDFSVVRASLKTVLHSFIYSVVDKELIVVIRDVLLITEYGAGVCL